MKDTGWKRRAFGILSFLGGGSLSLVLGSVSVVLLVCAARVLGLWEGIELQTLDLFLRYRPVEAMDERITVLEITDADLQALGTYPVPDDAMVAMLQTLQEYEPRVIGLDIFRDLPVINPFQADLATSQQANESLLRLLSTAPNVVVIEKILDPPVLAPAGVPLENIGFADALLDRDGFVRRSLLASPSDVDPDDYRLSFTIQLAAKYLEAEGLALENGIADPIAMRFGKTELFRVRANSGGYQNQDTGDNPVVLLNFRQHPEPFHTISLTQFMAGEFPADWVEDRVVLVGMTAVSTKDYINSAALARPLPENAGNTNPGLVPGVELQAHAISQLLSAVLDGRPMLRTWQPFWEYLWIVANGMMGLALVRVQTARSLSKVTIAFMLLGTVPLIVSYGLFLTGIWIPLLPAWAAYAFSGGGVLVYRVYQYEQSRRIRFEERQQILERSYNAIHNGPLQTLKSLIRQVSSQEAVLPNQIADQGATYPLQPWTSQWTPEWTPEWTSQLTKVDTELRNIYEFMQREYLQKGYSPAEAQIYLTHNYVINLKEPLHELLYQVYQSKLEESEPYFSAIKVKISDFAPMGAERLSTAQKESILRFFEEALCNMEQHATGVTRIQVVCKQVGEENVVRVIDNGKAMRSLAAGLRLGGGDGSRQAKLLAKRLSGRFSRDLGSATGTVCELVWPVRSPSLWPNWLSQLR